tara:strand:+ start:11410 stop:13026 length:1617 start_codon:yes stop_codon:yes gene_type:complete
MKIAGVYSGHDCSFYISENGKPIVHAEYERYIREKEPEGDSIGFMFEEYNQCDDIKHVALCHPVSKTAGYKESYEKLKNIVKKNDGEIYSVGHHQAHAANAFFSSNFEDALIITIDGGGYEDNNFVSACTAWKGKGNKVEPLHLFPLEKINIGGIWTRVTRYIFKLSSGWPRGHSAGTVMAMAALGNSERFLDDFYKMLTTDLAMASARPHNQPKGVYDGNDPEHPYLKKWAKLADESEENKFDIAAALQKATEKYLKGLIGEILQKNPSKNLCLSGGVALNSVAVGKFRKWFPDLEGIYVTPTPHDGGLPIGAAQYVWHQILDNPRIKWEDNYTPYLGYVYENVEETLKNYFDKVEWRKASDDQVVDLLSEENIIAVFGGGSESGRRALGNRSILADPRSPNMKDLINEKVKHRQWFRPFAPSILREEVSKWFEEDIPSPYMSFVLKFKEEARDKVPAVVHFDGSARLQTVAEKDNKWYYNFIKKWHKKSGVPIVLNTSFNDREPICETAQHAVNCFLKTDIDYLYFYDENLLVSKR